MTRHILKPQPARPQLYGGTLLDEAIEQHRGCMDGETPIVRHKVGDRFWVREAWRAPAIWDALAPRDIAWGTARLYEADGSQLSGMHDDCVPFPVGTPGRRRASMHLPRWASRLTLLVTDVCVERLQDISEEDAKAEGIVPMTSGRYHCGHDDEGEVTAKSPATAFAWLWNSLHSPDVWSANPWVAAISFDYVQGNIDHVSDLNVAHGGGLKAAAG